MLREAGTGSPVAVVEWTSLTTWPMGAAQDQLARLRRKEPWHAWPTMNARGVPRSQVGAITSLIAPTHDSDGMTSTTGMGRGPGVLGAGAPCAPSVPGVMVG